MLDKIKKLQQKCAIRFVGNTKMKGGIIMSKLQDNYSTRMENFEDFILIMIKK